ncbi:MAG: hypothetical protein HGA98_01055, partial [Deltaproteobacteria bacterium]|nr:hypothetical protein [Deltaproteobacteria bacterium]
GEVPEGLRELGVDLNVLVYGLPRPALGALVEAAARAAGGPRGCSASVEAKESRAHFNELHTLEKAP